MGCIQSILCAATYCAERVLTWTCCAFLLIFVMCTIVMLMVYGISLGYHYAQREISLYTMRANLRWSTSPGPDKMVVRLLAVNRSEVEEPPSRPLIEMYETKGPRENLYLEASSTAIVLLETERPSESELSPKEKALADRLIGRFRRSRNNTTKAIQFLRPLKNITTTMAST